jgi:hypothetical protein
VAALGSSQHAIWQTCHMHSRWTPRLLTAQEIKPEAVTAQSALSNAFSKLMQPSEPLQLAEIISDAMMQHLGAQIPSLDVSLNKFPCNTACCFQHSCVTFQHFQHSMCVLLKQMWQSVSERADASLQLLHMLQVWDCGIQANPPGYFCTSALVHLSTAVTSSLPVLLATPSA